MIWRANRIAAAAAGALCALALCSQAPPATASPAIPHGVRVSLAAEALREARRNGDARPYDIRAVSTTFAGAVRVECPHHECESHLYPEDTPVYLVAMRGRFTCGGCAPVRGHTARGTVIWLTILASSLFRTGLTITDEYPDLAAVGRPVALAAAAPAR